MRVFVIGSTGFIGTAVVKELLGAGHQVLGLTRSDKGADSLRALGASVQHGSLEDLESLKEGANASDGIVHLAFKHDFTDYEGGCRIDRQAITAIGDALVGSNKPFVITSGTAMLRVGQVGTEDDDADMTAPITAARAASEGLVQSYAAKGVRTAILRLPPTNHGDGDKGFVSMLVNSAKKSGVSAYIGDGQNRWAATHVLDTARLYRLALENDHAGSSTFHAVAEEGLKLKDIAEAIGSRLGLPVVSKTLEEAQPEMGFIALAASADNPTSSRKTRETLGWSPTHPTLLEDIAHGVYTPDQ